MNHAMTMREFKALPDRNDPATVIHDKHLYRDKTVDGDNLIVYQALLANKKNRNKVMWSRFGVTLVKAFDKPPAEPQNPTIRFVEETLTDPKSGRSVIIRYMDVRDAQKAGGLCLVLRNRWWIMHPKHGIAFGQFVQRPDQSAAWGTPQCNASYEIASKFITPAWTGHGLVYMPVVIVPSKPSEWTGS